HLSRIHFHGARRHLWRNAGDAGNRNFICGTPRRPASGKLGGNRVDLCRGLRVNSVAKAIGVDHSISHHAYRIQRDTLRSKRFGVAGGSWSETLGKSTSFLVHVAFVKAGALSRSESRI